MGETSRGELELINKSDCVYEDVVDALNQLWIKYKEFCPDENFKSAFKNNLLSLSWQMRLSLVLNDKGFILPRNENREWPDIVLTKENKKYFIEAVAANNESKQKHKKKNGVVVGSVNEDLVQSRITGSIRDKLEQFKNHNKGNFDYPFIIALNVGSVNESNTDDYVIKTAFGLGCQYIEFDKKSGEKVDGGYTKKNFITKSNGAILDSDLFEIEEYKVVSAIIYSRKNILNEFSLNCDDINIIYNPNAKIKITDSHFQCFEK